MYARSFINISTRLNAQGKSDNSINHSGLYYGVVTPAVVAVAFRWDFGLWARFGDWGTWAHCPEIIKDDSLSLSLSSRRSWSGVAAAGLTLIFLFS